MKTSCTLQIHIDGAWRQAGALSLTAPVEQDDGGSPLWASAIAQACEAAQIGQTPVKTAVREMASPLTDLLEYGRSLGIESRFLDPLAATVAQVRTQLEAL